MRRSLVVVSILGIIGASSPVLANSLQGVLNSDEIQSELFGVHMEGEAGFNLPWTECIEPNGKTIYTYQGVTLEGKMRVNTEFDLVCFDYEGRGNNPLNCFSVMRDGKDGYIFSGGAGSGGQFKTSSVQRNVTSCPRPDGPVS